MKDISDTVAIDKVVTACLIYNTRSAMIVISPKFIIRATRRSKFNKRNKREELVLTLGQPNYKERKFIKLCQKAGEPFPLKKAVLKFYKKGSK